MPQDFMILPTRTLGHTRANTSCYVHVRNAGPVPVEFLRTLSVSSEFMVPPSSTRGNMRANTLCYVHYG